MNFDSEKKHILIVEDSATQAEQLKYILEKAGYRVDAEIDALKAFKFLERKSPSIIISDVVMPNMDGFEFCSKIKQDKKFYHIPVMLLTALSEPQDIIKGLESGADNFIIKPYQVDYLLSQIEYMLANSKIRLLSKGLSSEIPDMGIEIYFAGKKHYIMSSQLQILDMLFSTFEIYVRKNKELMEMNHELAKTNDRIKALQGLIPICANCKKIRDDDGYWQQVDYFLELHSEADINYSICPECNETMCLNENPSKKLQKKNKSL